MPSRYLPGRYLGQAKVFTRRHVRNGANAESNLGGWGKPNSNLVRANALWVACTRSLPEHQDVRLGGIAKVTAGEDLGVKLGPQLRISTLGSPMSFRRS
jgi:hypothetical protein